MGEPIPLDFFRALEQFHVHALFATVAWSIVPEAAFRMNTFSVTPLKSISNAFNMYCISVSAFLSFTTSKLKIMSNVAPSLTPLPAVYRMSVFHDFFDLPLVCSLQPQLYVKGTFSVSTSEL
jgi:hypothetical protein